MNQAGVTPPLVTIGHAANRSHCRELPPSHLHVSVVLVVPSFFGHFRGVVGGATLGLAIGTILGVIMQDFIIVLKWGFIVGTLAGFEAELLGMFGDIMRSFANKHIEPLGEDGLKSSQRTARLLSQQAVEPREEAPNTQFIRSPSVGASLDE